MPDLRTLETFRAFVDTGSVSRAAQRVCRTQPQVGRTLTALEDEVGFPLFDRSSRPFGLTKPGREYYLQALQVLSAAQALERHALRARHSAGPHVHVFTTPFIAGAIVIDALAPLEQALGLTVSIDSRAHVDMEAWVANEVFDVGVVGFPIAHPAFEIEPFITVEAMLALPRGHRLADVPVVHFSDVAEEDFVLLHPRSLVRRHLESLAEAHAGKVIRARHEVTNGLIACQLVGKGRGIALTDPFIALSSGVEAMVLKRFEPRLQIEYAFYYPAWHVVKEATKEVARSIAALARTTWHQLSWAEPPS